MRDNLFTMLTLALLAFTDFSEDVPTHINFIEVADTTAKEVFIDTIPNTVATVTAKKPIVQTEVRIETETEVKGFDDYKRILRDTLAGHTVFKNLDEAILFVKYVKTQSNRLDDDNLLVIQVMLNRCREYGVDFDTYYAQNEVNCSQTIKSMKTGKVKVSFDINNPHDSTLLARSLQAYTGSNPLNAPSNLMYFESCASSPNKGCFSMKNLYLKKRHRFYLKPKK